MAAPNKDGLDYFSFDVDFFEDEKIEAISGEFGIKGELATVKLLCAIYNKGYFAVWNDLFAMKLLRKLPGVSKDLLNQIVNRLVKWTFFNETLFNSERILTSNGIQKRYFSSINRRNELEESVLDAENRGLLLVNVYKKGIIVNKNVISGGVNVNKNSSPKDINVDNNSQSKVNKSKVKQSTEEGGSKNGPVLDENPLEEPKTNINDIIPFIHKPYAAASDELKKMYTEEQYTDYQWFVKLLTNNEMHFANLFKSNYQVTLKQFKDLLSGFSEQEIVGGMQILCGTAIKPDFVMVFKIKEYIGYFNRDNKAKKGIYGSNEAAYTNDHTQYQASYGKTRKRTTVSPSASSSGDK